MSIKELYDNGIKALEFGGKIVHTVIQGIDYYDLYKQDTLILCDGENVKFEKNYNISTGLTYWRGVTEDNKSFYLTDEEYKIAVFA